MMSLKGRQSHKSLLLSQSTCQLCHNVKWQTNKNKVLRAIIQFSSLLHCQIVTVAVNIFQQFIYIMLCTDYVQVTGNR